MTAPLAIGIDLGGTNLKAALVDASGRVVESRSNPTKPERGPDGVIDTIDLLVNELCDSSGVGIADLVGAGVGSPGPLDFNQGTIIKAANLPGWKDVRLRERLHNRLHCRVVLENDANAAAFGEFWVGAGRDGRDFVLLTLGTGVGAGVILNGQILRGHFDNAAELGHMIMVPNGLPCPCGQRGCLEQYASAGAVARRAATLTVISGECRIVSGPGPGAADGPVPDLSISASRFLFDARHVAEQAAKGDALCGQIWNEACLYLAMACINIQHAYNVARIALGGGMGEAGEFLLAPVRRHLAEQRWSLHDDLPEIVLAVLGKDAGVVGAAGLVFGLP